MKVKIGLGIVTALFVFSLLINWDVIEFNKNEQQPVAVNDEIIDDIDDTEEEIEEDKGKVVIPPITPPENDEQKNKAEVKEEVKEIDGEKVLVKSTSKPKSKEIPEAMEKPKTESKPKEPPKLEDKEKDKLQNSEKPLTYKNEQKPKEVKGGTGSDGVVRDLNGNPIPVEGDSNSEINEVKGSDLLPEGEKAGEGDKF